MIDERLDGRFLAVHTPSRRRATFDTYLGAMTWLIVLDDRLGTQGWPINCNCLFAGTEPPRAA